MSFVPKQVCVVGLGYIGLPTAAVLANKGHRVIGVDIRPKIVDKINQGKVHIKEPDLDAVVHSAVSTGRLKAQLKPSEAEVFLIAVPTPFKGEYEPDMSWVVDATRSIAPFVRPGNAVILESTSPVGATEMVRKELAAAGVRTETVHVAFCPERVLPGRILREIVENDRVVGGLTPEATRVVKEFYEGWVEGQVTGTNAKTAELVKLAENSFRDVNIAFANELSMICAEHEIDSAELITLANRHPRVKILQPGCGVGGHCIAVDPWFIVATNPKQAKLIRSARETNLRKTHWVIEQIQEKAKDFEAASGRKPRVACMGLAFKPDVDDLRESPALEIAHDLKKAGLSVVGVEPNVESLEGLPLIAAESAVKEADLLIFLVAHTPFKKLQLTDRRWILDYCGALKA